MKTIIPFAIVIIVEMSVSLSAFTQKIVYTPPVQKYQVTLPFGYPQQAEMGSIDQHTTSSPCTTLLFEYGDGDFTTQYITTHKFNLANITGNTATALASLVRYYDTTHRPEDQFATAITYTTPTAIVSTCNTLLRSTQNLVIAPSSLTMRPSEYTNFVLSYRRKKGFIAVFYNETDGVFFKSINSASDGKLISDKMVKYIRTNKNQSVFTSLTQVEASSLSASTKSSMKSLWNNKVPSKFSNGFIITIDTLGETMPYRNIFFTLPPIPESAFQNAAINDSLTTIVAYFDTSASNGLYPATGKSPYPISMRLITGVHDPNFMSVLPSRFDRRGTHLPPAPWPILFKMHFQNTGLGSVDSNLMIKLYLPKGVINTIKDVSATLADKRFSIPDNKTIASTGNFHYEKHSSSSSQWDTVTFKFDTPYLAGVLGMPNAYMNPLTEGQINLTILLNNISQIPLFTYADVYFEQESPIRMKAKVCFSTDPDCKPGIANLPPLITGLPNTH